jgi:hypothetical protein
MTDPADPALAQRMIAADPLGASVGMASNAEGRTILTALRPVDPD